MPRSQARLKGCLPRLACSAIGIVILWLIVLWLIVLRLIIVWLVAVRVVNDFWHIAIPSGAKESSRYSPKASIDAKSVSSEMIIFMVFSNLKTVDGSSIRAIRYALPGFYSKTKII